MGILYIVGTPIGNLADITFRAIEVLKNADLIAAEDTRHTQKLLNHYEIKTSQTSFHKFNLQQKTPRLIDSLKSGKKIALVSDAGMPGISDPGEELVRAAVEANIKIVPIPGSTAAISALVASGLSTSQFLFVGFISKQKKKDFLQDLSNESRTMIFYEAPHRLLKTLHGLIESFGDRKAVVARELTKKFEEIKRDRLSNLLNYYLVNKPKGEIVLIVEGVPAESKSKEIPRDLIKELKDLGAHSSHAAKIIAKHFGVNRNEVYDFMQKC